MTDTLTGLLLERLGPWLTPEADPNGDHANYLSAIAAMGEEIFGLVWDQGDPDSPDYQPGFGSLFDVDTCKTQFLPFLAQMVGVPATALQGLSDSAQRQVIRNEAGMSRGTPAAIFSAAQRHLIGSQTLTLFERTAADGSTPDPYHFVLICTTSSTFGSDLFAAVDAVRPAGVQWTLLQTSNWLINLLEAAGYANITAFEAAFPDINHAETDVP